MSDFTDFPTFDVGNAVFVRFAEPGATKTGGANVVSEVSARKKPFGLRALGNNRDGVGFRSWVTAWIQVPINTAQPTKGLLGANLL
jgi:hypothetical protein